MTENLFLFGVAGNETIVDLSCQRPSIFVPSIMATSSPGEHEFVEAPSQDFFCPVTLELVIEPHQTLCCGNHISKEAAAKLQKDNKPCPLCKNASLQTIPDKFFKRKVRELKVRCPHKERGCEWVGELGSVEGHLNAGNAEGECKFQSIACTYQCGREMQRCKLAAHRVNECLQRPYKCPHCDYNATYSEVTTQHYSQCHQYPCECPNKCGKRDIERHEVLTHLEQCPCQVIECEFSHAGCTIRLQRAKMSDHISQSVEAHLSLASQTIATLQRQMAQLAAHLKPEVLLNTPSRLIPPPSIVMTNFTEHKSAGNEWYSPPFYSHIGGYKMCLRVDANGFLEGTGTHISVGVYLM